jgi:hypothetical protein
MDVETVCCEPFGAVIITVRLVPPPKSFAFVPRAGVLLAPTEEFAGAIIRRARLLPVDLLNCN